MRAVAVVVWRNKRRSNAVNTPLSNVEANLNCKDATDPSVVVRSPSSLTPVRQSSCVKACWL